MATTVYCLEADIERYLSAQGVTDFADHDEDTVRDTGVVTDCIEQASQEIELFLIEKHVEADLKLSKLVERWCTVMAARFLCQRRGNPVPASLEEEFEQVRVYLQAVREDRLSLPGIQLRDRQTPVWSNVHVDHRYRWRKLRRQPNSSKASKNDPHRGISVSVIGDSFGVR